MINRKIVIVGGLAVLSLFILRVEAMAIYTGGFPVNVVCANGGIPPNGMTVTVTDANGARRTCTPTGNGGISSCYVYNVSMAFPVTVCVDYGNGQSACQILMVPPQPYSSTVSLPNAACTPIVRERAP